MHSVAWHRGCQGTNKFTSGSGRRKLYLQLNISISGFRIHNRPFLRSRIRNKVNKFGAQVWILSSFASLLWLLHYPSPPRPFTQSPLTKIRELEKLRTKYETRKKSVLEFAGKPGGDQRERINRLLVEHKELLPEASVKREVENIARSTDQSNKVRYKISSVMTLSSKDIADVLNMRFTNISNWDWDTGQQGIPAMPRQQQMRRGLGGDEHVCQSFQ